MINLYYDKIIDGKPVPNGAPKFKVTPCVQKLLLVDVKEHWECPISISNDFYYAMRVLKAPAKIFSKDNNVKNLFYPIELGSIENIWKKDLRPYISIKVKNKIKKGKFKLLILGHKLPMHTTCMNGFKDRLKELVDYGIDADNIYLVLNDLNIAYKNLLGIKNVFGIDWGQIHSQLIYKQRFKQENIALLFPTDPNISSVDQTQLEKEQFNVLDWKPTKLYTALTQSLKPHNYNLIIDLHYYGLDKYGDWYFNENTLLPNNLDYVIDKGAPYLERIGKQKILQELKSRLPYEKNNPYIKFDNKIYNDSLMNIVVDDYVPPVNSWYKDEWKTLTVGPKVWRQIANGHPFALLGSLNALNYLNNEGYFTYNDLVLQKYDSITSTPRKIKMLCHELLVLNGKSSSELEEIKDRVIMFAEANKEKFFAKLNYIKFMNLFIDMRYE